MSSSGGFFPSDPFSNSPKSSFGDLITQSYAAEVTGKFLYNINSELFTDGSTGSGSVSSVNNMGSVSSGAASSSVGKVTSKRIIEYIAGTGISARFTALYSIPAAGNTQYAGISNDEDGFLIGYTDTDFSIVRRSGGVDTVTTQDNFSEDKLDGSGSSKMTIDPTKGNVFQVQFQWLGFGQICFSVEDPITGDFFVFHRIKYANSSIVPHIGTPVLPFQIESINTTNDTDIIVRSGSFGLYNEGVKSGIARLTHAAVNLKTGLGATETNILTIRNNATYQGQTNNTQVNPVIISSAVEGNKSVQLFCRKNATLGGTPSFVDFNSNTSVVAIDTAGTTVTGGILQYAFGLGKADSTQVQVTNIVLEIAPGETFTISAAAAGLSDVNSSITWEELF